MVAEAPQNQVKRQQNRVASGQESSHIPSGKLRALERFLTNLKELSKRSFCSLIRRVVLISSLEVVERIEQSQAENQDCSCVVLDVDLRRDVEFAEDGEVEECRAQGSDRRHENQNSSTCAAALMVHVVGQKRDDRDSDSTGGIHAPENHVLVELSSIGHDTHTKRNDQYPIKVDIFPAIPVREVSHDWSANDLDYDIKGDNERVLEVLDGLALVNVVLLLEKHGLEGVDADEHKGQHEIVD